MGSRRWVRRYRAGLTVGSAAVVVAAFTVLLLRGAAWLYGPGLRSLTPDQQVTAIDDVRGRLIQLGAGLLAAGALVYTALNFQLSREGHVTDRYTKAIEQLGSERVNVRLGAIYALERIMIDSARDHPTIVEVLAAYAREQSASKDPSNLTVTVPGATDVIAAVTVLGRRPSKRKERGTLNLRSTIAPGADLTGADLAEAVLTRAELTGADLSLADVTYADLAGADLTGADLTAADLVGANLTGAILINADLINTDLSHTNLTGAKLASAKLIGADLIGADLIGADLTGANLTLADVTLAGLSRAASLADVVFPAGYEPPPSATS